MSGDYGNDINDWFPDDELPPEPHFYDNGMTCVDCGVNRLVGGGDPCPGAVDRKKGEWDD
jgi:hypothetical protein